MLLNRELVQASINRAGRYGFDPVATTRVLGEGDRSKGVREGQRRQLLAPFLARTGDAVEARSALERMIGGNDLVGINYLELGTLRARAVCRVHLRDSTRSTVGFGTGFLVAPGVLMTNHHVIASAEEARFSLAEFNYERDVRGDDKPVATFALLDDPPPVASKGLDFCLVAVSRETIAGRRTLDAFGWLPLNPGQAKSIVGEYLTIIQHPGGERKQVCVRENKLLKYDEDGNTIWYMTDTVGGSSGSPVFNGSWQVVALHHSGVPKTDPQGRWLDIDGKPCDPSTDDSQVAWLANEGIRISRIVAYLRSSVSGHPLASAVLQHLEGSVVAPVYSPPERAGSGLTSEVRDGELCMTVPIQIAVRIADLGGAPRPLLPAMPPRPAQDAAPSIIEKVSVDQSNYDARTGYDEDFLGGGGLRVPLPVIEPARAKHILSFDDHGHRTAELKYWNYSVTMNGNRRLAFFSAVNVDSGQRPDNAGRDGDRWYFDKRIDSKYQIGTEFYGQQREFEVDRTENPFDRGHLTRRLDAQWGETGGQAKRNGDDSFHWTNCVPQHWKFNQGAKMWLGLEDYVVENFARRTGRACVINGPVLDAPLSTLQGGRVVPKLDGPRHPDPTFKEVAIPKAFFKLVAFVRSSGGLGAAGFLMSQEELLAQTDRIRGIPPLPEERLTPAEAALFQVRIADLQEITGLGFGPLVEADDRNGDETVVVPRRIERLDEVLLARNAACAGDGRPEERARYV